MRIGRAAAASLLAVSLMGAACGKDEPTAHAISPPVFASPTTGENGITIAPSGSVPPTGSPGVTGTVDQGTAAVSTTGGITASVTYPSLSSPAIWTLPPGGFALVWRGQAKQILGLSGTSFAAQQPTSPERVLSFTVRGPDGLVTFTSSEGECQVTISPALPDQMAGTFLCTQVPSEESDVIVNAQGSFSAG
jgi:hypothetical protein